MANKEEEKREEPAEDEEIIGTTSSDTGLEVTNAQINGEEGAKDVKEEIQEEFLGSEDELKVEVIEEEEEPSEAPSVSKEEKEKLVSQVEAAFFLAGRPLGEMELAEFFNSDRITIRWAIRRIKRTLEEQNSALEVIHLTKDRWVLQLCEEFSRGLYDYIEQFIPKEEMLSKVEIDTLTEIAYRQPITTTNLVKILGRPDVYEDIRNLTEKGLITSVKEDRSNVLRTSKKFADIFGFDAALRNLKIQLVWRLKKRAKLDKPG